MLLPIRPIAIEAVRQLSLVDYTIANRVTEDIAKGVEWAYEVDNPILARNLVHLLQTFDDLGSLLIAAVIWIVDHTG